MQVFIFDKNKNIPGVRGITVENLVDEIRNKNDHIKRAFISSANSLGFMDGGSDLGYMNSIVDIQRHVQEGFKKFGFKSKLNRNCLPVGCAMFFKVPNEHFFFVSAPTMFLPQKVFGTSNPYFALSAALKLCLAHNIEEVYVPMMCTNWGGFSYEASKIQMDKAINETTCSVDLYRNDMYTYYFPPLKNLTEIMLKQPHNYANTEFFTEFYPIASDAKSLMESYYSATHNNQNKHFE